MTFSLVSGSGAISDSSLTITGPGSIPVREPGAALVEIYEVPTN